MKLFHVFFPVSVLVLVGCQAPPEDLFGLGGATTSTTTTSSSTTSWTSTSGVDAGPDADAGCTPKTCMPGICGALPDGCGGKLACGGCGTTNLGGKPVQEVCDANVCVCSSDAACSALDVKCGTISVCGEPAFQCGSCATGQTCLKNMCSPCTSQTMIPGVCLSAWMGCTSIPFPGCTPLGSPGSWCCPTG